MKAKNAAFLSKEKSRTLEINKRSAIICTDAGVYDSKTGESEQFIFDGPMKKVIFKTNGCIEQ